MESGDAASILSLPYGPPQAQVREVFLSTRSVFTDH